jgi:hypothetical protein
MPPAEDLEVIPTEEAASLKDIFYRQSLKKCMRKITEETESEDTTESDEALPVRDNRDNTRENFGLPTDINGEVSLWEQCIWLVLIQSPFLFLKYIFYNLTGANETRSRR